MDKLTNRLNPTNREKQIGTSRMDLNQALGQLFIIGFRGSEIPTGGSLEKQLQEGQPGGVILFDRPVAMPAAGNIVSLTQLRGLTRQLRRLSDQPLLIGIDQEGGRVQRLKPRHDAPAIASARELGEQNRAELTAEQSRCCAAVLADAGINLNFAPVVDLAANPDNPVIGGLARSFSNNPETVTTHARIWIEQHRRHGLLSCLKHFPGHGSSTSDSHLGFTDISDTWEERELEPFRELIESSQADLIMTGHLFNRQLDPDHPATLSSAIVERLLRQRLGFAGVVVSDDLQMRAVTDHYGFAESIRRALAAGIDMIIIGNNLEYRPELLAEALRAVRDGLDSGLLTESTVKSALERIHNLKNNLGVLPHGKEITNP